MENFMGLTLPAQLTNALTKMEYNTPTPVQAKCIPIALEGRDILASAQTGTGKTAAFSIPMIAKLIENPRLAALIMLPTRELAVQVESVVFKMLGGVNSSIKTAVLIGGESMPMQLKALARRPRVIIGTPGRINDHLTRGSLKLHDAGILVLDETDRMLDMGFGIQIDKIIKFCPQKRQTLMFSATLPKNIMSMAQKYLTNPERIEVGTNNAVATNIKQEIINCADTEKYSELTKQLLVRNGSVIVFVRTKRGADKLATKLSRENFKAEAIHGDLPQRKRERVIKAFRNKEHRIMVATDIAARGLDIPHIEHVINYDLPEQAEDYIHRIGRTARAGAEGSALCLVTPADKFKMSAINKLLNPGGKFEKEERNGDTRSYAPKRGGNNRRRNFSGGGKAKFGGGERSGPTGGRPGGNNNGRRFNSKPSGERKAAA